MNKSSSNSFNSLIRGGLFSDLKAYVSLVVIQELRKNHTFQLILRRILPGGPVSPIVANLCMEGIEESAISSMRVPSKILNDMLMIVLSSLRRIVYLNSTTN